MKNCLILLSLLLGFTTTWAQSTSEYGTPEERATKMTDRMQKEIPLQAGLLDTIYALNLKYASRIQQEVIDPGMNKLSAYFKIRNINKEKEGELLPLLTTEQIAEYEKMKTAATRELMSRFF